ncbi:MAG: deaminase, partial [bacterium]
IQAAIFVLSIKGAVLYCTHQPCILCSKMIFNAGIKDVIYSGEYPDELAFEMFKEAGVVVKQSTKS